MKESTQFSSIIIVSISTVILISFEQFRRGPLILALAYHDHHRQRFIQRLIDNNSIELSQNTQNVITSLIQLVQIYVGHATVASIENVNTTTQHCIAHHSFITHIYPQIATLQYPAFSTDINLLLKELASSTIHEVPFRRTNRQSVNTCEGVRSKRDRIQREL